MIGGEGVAPMEMKYGRVFPGTNDAARYGFIENNRVENMSTETNPAVRAIAFRSFRRSRNCKVRLAQN
jgi:hypothetical protein